ncbi:MAG: amidohydrolase family protein [Treponema sp.]|uniref:amidohydrolase family protein n=1 Tax=Treponema sp. TaxID=166 RepID=UPI0025ED92A8|nr:amidohydrolase family protein [Treponema sp.]MBQ9283335.1 amidohydrolase family protein [Treponema sp.]MBR1714145.1 amidohydrolase family protein [Treponema sp.]
MTARYDDLKTHDFHTHIGQYWNTYYDWHDVFSCLKANGISGTTCAYLTPKFDDMKTAVEFHHAVVEEWHTALKFASSIKLEVKPLWWADPLVLRSGLSVSGAFFELPFAGIALHPRLHDWTKENSSLTDAIFEFAKGQDIPLFIHTGLSEDDSPYLFEPWFKKFPEVEAHLAHCRDSEAIIDLFSKYPKLLGDTAFCPDESYDAICKAGFSERMLYGTDFPITHYVELSETKHVQSDFQPAFEELCKNYKKLKLKSDCLIV